MNVTHLPMTRRFVFFVISLVVALSLPGLGYISGLELEGRKTLFILTFAVGLWMSEAIPAFAVSLLIVGFQIFFLGGNGMMIQDEALIKYTQSWSSPVIWLLMGGFCLSLAMSITKIDADIARAAHRYLGQTSRLFLFGIMIATAILSMFISNTASTALFLAILLPTVSDPEQDLGFRRCLLIGVPAAASIGGIGTLIGSTPNAIAHAHLAQLGIPLEFLSWAKFGFPISAILVVTIWAVLIWTFKPATTFNQGSLVVDADYTIDSRLKRQRLIVFVTFMLTLGLWVSAPIHKISVSVISFVPMTILTVGGVIKSADIRRLPWDTLILIMGGMSLGDSVIESGLADFFIAHLPLHYFGLVSMLFIMGYVSVLLSNIMSNTAAAAILIPLGTKMLPEEPLLITLTIALSASLATMLPVSTPPNAISYATGLIETRYFIRVGCVLAAVGPALTVLCLRGFL
jgi:solute carrier family 13 (sodium-dependent dicarboxylate transporter), member 2/3/5